MAGTDIYGYKRNPKPSGVFSSEDSKLFIGSSGSAAVEGYLIQSWNMSYSQNVEELFEIGSNRLYWAKGRPVGQGSIGRVIGAKDADTGNSAFFPKEAFDICAGGATLMISAIGGHCTTPGTGVEVMGKGIDITMSGVVITTIGFGMQVTDVKLAENFAWRFAHLELNAS
jgi:hypothetical protein